MSTAPTESAPQQVPAPVSSPSGWSPRRPRSVAMPPGSLLARFAPLLAEEVRGWQEVYQGAIAAVQSVDDVAPGGLDHAAACAEAARAVRADPDSEGLAVEGLARWLRVEPAERAARAVVQTAKSDQQLVELLAAVAADGGLREQVDGEIEAWVARMCRLLDSDAPGVVEMVEAANETEWRALVGLLTWLDGPVRGYRLRPRGNTDARVSEALAMHAMRRGQTVHLPYQGGISGSVADPAGFEPTGRYDADGRVLVEAPSPTPLALGSAPAPGPPPVQARARTRWWGVSA